MVVTFVVLLAAIICSAEPQVLIPTKSTPTITQRTTTTHRTPRQNPIVGCKPDWSLSPNRDNLARWLLLPTVCCQNFVTGCTNPSDTTVLHTANEYEGYDGWYNNHGRPDLGAIDTPLLRRVPAAYEDGTYKPAGGNRPNPLTLSQELLKGDIGTMSRVGKNALLVFFGQQVVEEILDAQRAACPPEYFNIQVPKDHEYRVNPGHSEMPVLRTRYDMKTGYSPNNPRQQLNEITPYLDGGLVYGVTKAWSDNLRLYSNGTLAKDGLLATTEDLLFPEVNKNRLPLANPPPPFHHHKQAHRHELFKVERFFKLGNPRGNENPFLLTFGVLWFRWHNYLARNLKKLRPNWSGEKIYNEARKWVIASQQRVVFYEWLPTWLGDSSFPTIYKHYDPSVDPQIDQFFQAAAFRFGHTLVTSGVYLRDYARNGCGTKFANWSQVAVRTCNNFWRPQDSILAKHEDGVVDIDRLLMGMAYQSCEEEDHKIVEDLRGRVFGPLEFSRRDLMALNIQRARDHGLPDFNTARKAYGLRPVTNVTSHFKYVDKTYLDKLLKLYGKSLDNIDIWIGGILETGDGPGEFFRTVIKDQFERIRNGDRFWFENSNNKLFRQSDIERLHQLRLYDIIMAVTKMDHDDIPQNVFSVPLNASEIPRACVEHLQERNCVAKPPCSGSCSYTCWNLPPLSASIVNENCTIPATYDYFTNSELSFILSFSFLVAFIFGMFGFISLLWKKEQTKRSQRNKNFEEAYRRSIRKSRSERSMKTIYSAHVMDDIRKPFKLMVIMLTGMEIHILNIQNIIVRKINLSRAPKMEVFIMTDDKTVGIRTPNEYDLILQFGTSFERQTFLEAFEMFTHELSASRERITNISLKSFLKTAITKRERQKRLEIFFRVVFSQSYHIKHSEEEILKLDSKTARKIIFTEITLTEFAEALSMKPNSEFVQKIFDLVDKDKNGFISFREFLDMLVIFSKGTADDKAKLMFDIYDINATGVLTQESFISMFKSLLESVNANVDQKELEDTIRNMMKRAQLDHKESIVFEDFKKLLAHDVHKLSHAHLDFRGIEHNVGGASKAQEVFDSIYGDPQELKNRIVGDFTPEANNLPATDPEEFIIVKQSYNENTMKHQIIKHLSYYSREYFWICLFTLFLWAIFGERAYYYTVEREHSGLRRIAGYGVTITRGAASAIMFCYSALLLTMCRNSITVLRDTKLNRYIPFDSALEFHKYISYWGLFFTVVHIIGHAFNFYHISTQPSDDLTCLFRNYFHSTHEIPKFHYWLWQTMTGVTGVILSLIVTMIYCFSLPIVRKSLYNWFWFTHSLYPLFYIFMILHGSGRLIQEPYFPYFFTIPCIIFVLDLSYSLNRKKVEIHVLKAELLPSDVTTLEFRKPPGFSYKSGQWVRIACLGHNAAEFHPFTLSSSPHEPNLTVHIRAVGPWTKNIRLLYDIQPSSEGYPKIYLDGPFGEGHQHWDQFNVSVLIGGGIGITPFASILKDIVHRNSSQQLSSKIYFLWVTRTQKQFEWLVDILRELEDKDIHRLVSVHLFITQFYQKFDLRTILLYICERHFQRTANKSLFTGLKAVTHFGRPNFKNFFDSLQSLHQTETKIGVFSCGPPTMSRSVEQACRDLNASNTDGPIFENHFSNF